MLTIRLQRVGKKGQPSYRIVVAERRSKVAAPPVEDLGYYDPLTKKTSVKAERAKYWIQVGAQATPTVHNLMVREKVISSPKIAIKISKKAPAPAA